MTDAAAIKQLPTPTPHFLPVVGRTYMRIRHLFAVIFTGLLISLMHAGRFKCGALSCGRTFDSSGALLRHRSSCIYYRQGSTARANLQRKHLLLRDTATNPASKKAKLDQVNSPLPDVSHLTLIIQQNVRLGVDESVADSTASAGPQEKVLRLGSPVLPHLANLNPNSSAPAVATNTNPPVCGESGSVPESIPNSALGNSGRPARPRRLPVRFRDVLPEPSLPYLPSLDPGAASASESSEAAPRSILPRVILHVFDSFRTTFNVFSIAREYRHRPSYDPDSFLTIDQLTNTTYEPSSDGVSFSDVLPPPPPPWPWKNMGIWRLMTWMVTGSRRKSEAEVTRLVHEVINSKDFDRNHFIKFNAHTEMKHFDKSENAPDTESDSTPHLSQDAWKESTISISVPTRERHAGGNGQDFVIPGLFHRSLTGIIRAVFTEKAAKWFHLTPFKRIWKSPLSGQEQRVYDELYTSDTWITAHDEIQKQRRDDGCKLERVIAGLMLWSDATHLAQFGTASAWPVYLFFGNQSKYVRAGPNPGACHPVAFIPTVSLLGLISQGRCSDLLHSVTRNLSQTRVYCIKEKELQ